VRVLDALTSGTITEFRSTDGDSIWSVAAVQRENGLAFGRDGGWECFGCDWPVRVISSANGRFHENELLCFVFYLTKMSYFVSFSIILQAVVYQGSPRPCTAISRRRLLRRYQRTTNLPSERCNDFRQG
jgi:hypothetical protein